MTSLAVDLPSMI